MHPRIITDSTGYRGRYWALAGGKKFMTTSMLPRPRRLLIRLAVPALTCAWLSACAPLATVHNTTPRLPASYSSHEPPALEQARLEAASAQKLVQSDPKQAIIDSSSAA